MNKAFILPFAGGSSYYFEYIRKYFNSELNVHYLNLHDKEKTDGSFSSIQEIALYLSKKIISEIDINDTYFLFGHSMGSLLVYEITKIIKIKGIKLPKFVVVSGLIAPDVLTLKNKIRTQIKKTSVFQIENCNSALKHDLELVNEYQLDNLEKLDTDIFVMFGNEDAFLKDKDEVERWRLFTNKAFKIYEYLGDHFYFHNRFNRKSIAEILESEILNKG